MIIAKAPTSERLEARRQWVAALRSGKYQQGTGVLRDGDRYCCLGIACEVSGLASWFHGTYLGAVETLPEKAVDWLGLFEDDPHLAGHYATTWNDGLSGLKPTSFPDIAELIEAEYIRPFEHA